MNGSRGSVMLAILGHNGINWALFTTGTLTGQPVTDNWPAALGLAVLAIVAIAATRGRLGRPPARQREADVSRQSQIKPRR